MKTNSYKVRKQSFAASGSASQSIQVSANGSTAEISALKHSEKSASSNPRDHAVTEAIAAKLHRSMATAFPNHFLSTKKIHGSKLHSPSPASHGFIESSFGTVQTLFLKHLSEVHTAVQTSATLVPFDPFSPGALRREFAFSLAAAENRSSAPGWPARRTGVKSIKSVGGAS